MTTELKKDQQFIDDIFNNWLVATDLPVGATTDSAVVASVYNNIKARESWVLIGADTFEWRDYLLSQLNNGTFHIKAVIDFIDWLVGGDFLIMIRDALEDNQQCITAYEEFIKWATQLCGRNVRYIEDRAIEHMKRFDVENPDRHKKRWRMLLTRLKRRLAPLKRSEVAAAEGVVTTMLTEARATLGRKKDINSTFDTDVTTWEDMKERYAHVLIQPVPVIQSANTYEGKVSIELKSEAIQKWASALNWLTDREELHRALYQVMLETGEMLRDRKPFIEGQFGAITLERNGFVLGTVTHELVCRTCGKAGGGNCPDCGPCCGY
ncbi:TPA: hypothetical protein P0E30_003750 [Vibrio harveyi]|nr:hypothetical protein [Vibrio harveyi]